MTDEHTENPTLDALARRLPRDIAPREDLWPGIAAAIEAGGLETERLAARLPAALEPPVDLWPGIASRLGPRHAVRPAWRAPLAAAASFGVVTIATLASLFALGTRSGIDAEPEPAGVRALVAGIGGAAGFSVVPARQALRGPTATIAEALEAVRRERLSIERALEADSDNPDLLALWSHVYATELSLTSEVSRAAERYEWSTEI